MGDVLDRATNLLRARQDGLLELAGGELLDRRLRGAEEEAKPLPQIFQRGRRLLVVGHAWIMGTVPGPVERLQPAAFTLGPLALAALTPRALQAVLLFLPDLFET